MSPQVVDIPMEQADLDLQASLRTLCGLLERSEQWADRYDRNGLSAQAIRDLRRDAVRAHRASRRRLCVGLFGPSGAGKSFLIGELGRGGTSELMISRQGVDAGPVAFLKRINPNKADEATAVVCRLTTQPQVVPERPGTFVARMLSHADVLKSLATGFVYECEFPDVEGVAERCVRLFEEEIPPGEGTDPFLEALDDAWAYVEETFDNRPYFRAILRKVNIRRRIREVGGPLSPEQRRLLASTLWGMGTTPAIDLLYSHLIGALERLGQPEYLEIDQEAVIFAREDESAGDESRSSTIVDATILRDLMQGKHGTVPTYCGEGASKVVEMEKATVSALVAELCLPVERGEEKSARRIVDVADILDFPGARAGRAGAGGKSALLPEQLGNDPEGRRNVVELFKRGKLTYLFEGYCREREITVLNFCIDGFERPECHDVVPQVTRWVEERYPQFDNLEAEELEHPCLFLCLTKFDKLLQGVEEGGGVEKRWHATVWKIVGFFDRAQNSWMTNWGRVAGRPFGNWFWVRNPEFAVNPKPLEEAKRHYLQTPAVRKFIRDYQRKWEAAAPQSLDDQEHTGIALLASSILRKLRPEVKRRELAETLRATKAKLEEILGRHYVSPRPDDRAEAARKSANRFIELMREREKYGLFGPLLDALGLPAELVHRRIESISEGAGMFIIPPASQMEQFVDGLVEDWLQHVKRVLQKEDGLMRLIGEEAATVTGFVEQLAVRARSSEFRNAFIDSIRFFFEHPQGLQSFRQPLTAVCCRTWSDFVTTLGYTLQPAPDPKVPPKLTRDVPWRRYMKQWERYMEELYVGNCAEPQRIPEGNDMLGAILEELRAIPAE